jgi:rare lipoprotein A
MHTIKLSILALSILVLSACSTTTKTTPPITTKTTPKVVVDGKPDSIPVDIASIPDAVPVEEVRTRAGNPKTYKVLGKRYTLLADSKNYVQKGIASWYGTKFHGRKTANGEIYNMYKMTAAHKTLPIPSYARVTHLKNKRSVVVRINDRGPFHGNRIIDLSYAAAIKLGITKQGTGLVEVRTLEPGKNLSQNSINKDNQAAKGLYLQVGSFSQQTNAIALQKRIQAHNIVDHRILSSSEQGNPVHKVQIGPIKSTREFDNLTSVLAKLGIDNSHLVKN